MTKREYGLHRSPSLPPITRTQSGAFVVAHRRYGVNGEHNVADLHYGQHQQQRRGLAHAVLMRKETVALILVADGDEAPAGMSPTSS